jgi:hypothetical protein
MALRGGSRLNEYFIDKSGISREVIQADICRYLGNDALVKPGIHNVRHPQSSQSLQVCLFLALPCCDPGCASPKLTQKLICRDETAILSALIEI